MNCSIPATVRGPRRRRSSLPATLIAARARFGISLVALAVATLVGGLLLVPDAARAANATVSVGSPTNQFNANVSTINVGDKVTFTWAAGTHVVDLMDVSADLTMDATHTSGTTDDQRCRQRRPSSTWATDSRRDAAVHS